MNAAWWRDLAAALTGYRKRPAPGASPPRAPANPEPRLLMTSRFYDNGVVYVDDHVKQTTHRFDPPPGDEDWDAALREELGL